MLIFDHPPFVHPRIEHQHDHHMWRRWQHRMLVRLWMYYLHSREPSVSSRST
jgi:hypothetical protein